MCDYDTYFWVAVVHPNMATSDTPVGGASRLPDEVVADILEADRRRIALEILAEREEPIVIDDLAAAVRARELGTEPDAVSRSDRRTVRDEFFETHLPKLTATEVVTYDSMVGTLSLSPDEHVTSTLS